MNERTNEFFKSIQADYWYFNFALPYKYVHDPLWQTSLLNTSVCSEICWFDHVEIYF